MTANYPASILPPNATAVERAIDRASAAALARIPVYLIRGVKDPASCPLALSSALYVEQQAKPLTRQLMASDLRQIDHLGSFACRNIYHREQARRSEHATADALDVSGFRLTDGRRISVLQGWRSDRSHPWLAALLSNSCPYFGNALGPEYNAAHANHFHFGMRGQGFCF